MEYHLAAIRSLDNGNFVALFDSKTFAECFVIYLYRDGIPPDLFDLFADGPMESTHAAHDAVAVDGTPEREH